MPRGSLWLLQPGAYDIEIGDRGQPTRIVVFEGRARFVGGAADMPIDAGKFVEVTGNYPAVATVESDWTGTNPAKASTAAAATNAAASAPDGAAPATAASPVPEPPSGTVSAQTPVAPLNAPAADNRSAAPSGTAADRRAPASARGQTQFTAGNAPVGAEGPGAVTAEAGQKPSDDFLFWVEQSDEDQQQQTPRQTTQYVSAETTGADDLDRYGRWSTVADAGPVWFPTSVPDDWAPYRFGHWDWIEPWGWTWIDDQPWGFALFHYGRWVNIDGHWGWAPGAVDPHPVYAPALVAFVDAPADSGGGPDGGPDVGWFPLGPGDDYAPWYQAGPDYVVAVNAPEHGHFHDQRAHPDGGEPWCGAYFNRRFGTVVSRNTFADARRIDRDMVRRIDAERLDQAAVMRGAPHAVPAVFRAPEMPGEFRGEPRGAAPAAVGAGGLHARPGGVRGPQREPGIAARAGVGDERTPQTFGRLGAERRPAAVGPAGAAQYNRAEAGRRPPPAPQGMAAGYRGNAQQFARPGVSQGFRGTPQFGRPQATQGMAAGFR